MAAAGLLLHSTLTRHLCTVSHLQQDCLHPGRPKIPIELMHSHADNVFSEVHHHQESCAHHRLPADSVLALLQRNATLQHTRMRPRRHTLPTLSIRQSCTHVISARPSRKVSLCLTLPVKTCRCCLSEPPTVSGIHQHTMEGAKKASRLIATRQNHAFLPAKISGVLSLA